tara:strand:+ start:11993 stop:14500 length:2508 start_codon:yes stop_codon:yes gene_type:complete
MANTEKIVVQVVVQGDKQLDNLQKKTKSTTIGFGKLAAGVLGAVTAFRTATNAIGTALKTFKDFEFQMAKVRAVTGATERDFKKLHHSARELGRTTFFTATEVGKLQENYAKLGFTTQEILDAQEATLELATATSSDLGRAAIVAGSAVRGFGLDANETKRVVDVMAVAFTSSALDIEKFQTSMTKVAPIAKSAGFSIEDTTAIMAQLADSGIEASIAGTSFRNILLKMQSPTSDLTKAFGKTIHSFDELLPAMKMFVEQGGSMADIMEVVDLRQAAAFEQMLTSADSAEQLRDALLEATDAAKEMSDIIKNSLEGDLRELTSAWEGLQEAVVRGNGRLSIALRSIVDVITEGLNMITDWNKTTSDLTIDLVADQMKVVNTQLDEQVELFKSLSEEEKVTYGKTTSDLIQQRIDDLKEQRTEQNRLLRHNRLLNKDYSEQRQNITVLSGAIGELILTRDEEIEKEKSSLELKEERKKLTDNERITLGDLKNKIKELREERDLLDSTNVKSIQRTNQEIEVTQKLIDKLQGKEERVREVNKEKKKGLDLDRELLDFQLELLMQGELSEEQATEVNKDLVNQRIEDLKKELDFIVLSGDERKRIMREIHDLQESLNNDDVDMRQKQIDGVSQLGQQLITLAGEDEKMQKIRKIGIQISAAAAIANNIEALSLAAKGAAQQSNLLFPANIVAMLSTVATIFSLFANIKALKNSFGDGGVIDTFANGGMVNGKSHAQGGEKFAVGGRVVELEGGEAVINKRSTAMFRNQLSAMNTAGGGVKFADGGLLNMPSFSQQQFNALGQNQMMGAMGSGGKVVVVEADITDSQNLVSVIQADAKI